MTATAAEIAKLRRMVNEMDDATYTDDDIAAYIEAYPVLDERGEVPYTWDVSTTPPSKDDNDDWIPTYDLNAAAADIWGEKAASVAQDFHFTADGGTYSREQVVAQYQQRERFYRGRRRAGTVKMVVSPPVTDSEDPDWVVND